MEGERGEGEKVGAGLVRCSSDSNFPHNLRIKLTRSFTNHLSSADKVVCGPHRRRGCKVREGGSGRRGEGSSKKGKQWEKEVSKEHEAHKCQLVLTYPLGFAWLRLALCRQLRK